MIQIILCGGLIFWAAASHAVSRVGPGTLWNPEIGFTTTTPANLTRYQIANNDNVRGDGNMILDHRTGGLQPQFMFVYMLKNEQPVWVGLTDREQFRQHYLRYGWVEFAHPEACVQALKKDNGQSVSYILSWGLGQGVLISTSTLPQNLRAAQSTVMDLRLTGVCGWK